MGRPENSQGFQFFGSQDTMIPKIAHFHWEGTMNWMRWATIRSFEKFHQDYEIRLIRTPDDIKSAVDRPYHRGDWSIYRALKETGGWAIDLDIVFVRRIPDEWLDTELCVCKNTHPFVFQMAAIGAAPGSEFIKRCDERAGIIALSDPVDYQAFGAGMLFHFVVPPSSVDQPMSAFCHVPWFEAHTLWGRKDIELPQEAVGVHWYGGHETSKKNENEPPSDAFIVRLAKEILGEPVSV